MSRCFVHLHVHTEYSLIDGIARVKSLVKASAAAGMGACAITDQANLFGMVKFYKAALGAGVKPIIGVDAWIHNDEEPFKPWRVVFLCQNNKGYRNLTRLISRAYIEGQRHGRAVIEKKWLYGASEGLIVLSGGVSGDVGHALTTGNHAKAEQLLNEWKSLFPKRFYLELNRTGRANEEDHVHAAVALAIKTNTPVVATNDVRFLKADEFESHEARVCIHDGTTLDDPRRERRYSEQQFLRTPEQMEELFADIPEALENTVEIAKRCNVELTLGKNFLPNFPVATGMTMDEFFAQQSREGLEHRLAFLFDRNAPDFLQKRKAYDERLEIEIDVIQRMGFAGYFLIVADFIQWAKKNGIPVGPGRGSGAGSLVAYALTITDLDPLAYDLLFERFLNPERVSMPDFDVDFCMENRDKVIEYVAEHYGRHKVSQIITYGTMAAKAVVRDVGRVLGHPYGFVDKIAKLIPFELGITLEKALEDEPLLRERYEKEDDVKTLIDLARSLEGITRNAGKHAGGVVIAPTDLTDFAPLYCEEGGDGLVTQFDKDDVEAVGLVKFDFLGLRTLTIIDWAIKSINESRRTQGLEPLDITKIPIDDQRSFALLKACQTTAVFQLESRGMKDLIKRLQPDNFEEIVALVALFRPGPLQSGMVDDFINRKHGRAKIEYPHPDLAPILKPTYGVILYQEQVMQIAQVLAGYTLGGADMLRRAMGKKKPEEMAKQRAFFVDGSKSRGVEEATASYIFDLMEKFAGYGFNKSHSAAYALVSYQTAWLKSHHPAAFMAAVMSADMDNTDKVVNLVEECAHMKIKLNAPDINSSCFPFLPIDEKSIRYGLGAIKGAGFAAIQVIVDAREKGGVFRDLFDFCRRVDMKKVNRRVVETLIRSGSMDALGPNRASMMNSLTAAIQSAEQLSRDSLAGQGDLFNLITLAPAPLARHGQMQNIDEWDEEQKLEGEKETLGFYLSSHPLVRYELELKRFTSARIGELKPDHKTTVTIAGMVMGVRTMKTKRGDTMAFVGIDDRSGRIEVAVFSEPYEKYRELLNKDRVLVISGEVSVDEYSGGFKMSAREIFDINQARENYGKRLRIKLKAKNENDTTWLNTLADVLSPYRKGQCPVSVLVEIGHARARYNLGQQWAVRPTDDLIKQLRKLAGNEAVDIEY